MASRKAYAYYLRGSQIALIEQDSVLGDGQTLTPPGLNDVGPDGSQLWKSPLTAVTDGIEIEYAYSPRYFINETDDLSSSIGNYMSDGGNLVITSNTVILSAFADGTDGDTTDVTVTSAAHGFSNGDSVLITGTSNYNGTYTIDQVTEDAFDIEDTFNVGEVTGSATTLATLNVNYGNLGGYNISDGSYIVLKNADQFNGLHKTVTKDAHNGGTNNKIKLETKYSGSTSLSSLSSVGSIYYNINVLADESDTIDLPDYLAKALIYYVKAKLAEDVLEMDKKDYFMREFYAIIEKHESSKIWGARMIAPGPNAIR